LSVLIFIRSDILTVGRGDKVLDLGVVFILIRRRTRM